MRKITNTIRGVLSLLIGASALIAPPFVDAFQEGWESSPVGTYEPDTLPLPLIPADEGDWILGDTVSEFPECGSTPHTAEILSRGGNRSLRVTSNDSSSSCADNVWVNIVEVPPLNLNPNFSVPLTAGTIISFEETGNLISPATGSPYCVVLPCGDTISLTLEDTRGNMLAYILQHAPGAVPNKVRSFYREVFIDSDAGTYSRNLFADFNTIPDFNPSRAKIRTIAFQVKEHGAATIDNICIGTSGCVSPPPVPVPDQEEIIGTWSNGIWYWDVAESEWMKMTASSPTGDIAAGDFTGDGKADVASCWDNGLWYQDGATLGWTKVSATAPDSVTAGDVTGDGRSDIIGTWSNGIWYWDDSETKWTKMAASTPTGDIAAGEFTGDGKADVASCWDNGLWYQDGATLGWTKVSATAPDSVTAGDATGDGRFEIIGIWSNGIWYWDDSETKWTKMTASTPTGEITAGDFTGDGKADVASCWDNGLWYQDGATLGWTKVSNRAPRQLTSGDITGN